MMAQTWLAKSSERQKANIIGAEMKLKTPTDTRYTETIDMLCAAERCTLR